ncbi:MAG: hypothetical protein LUF90_03895 [Rikenellaceae bacterium]|nr:hypothetical protein [Rikenellaceae bacterium]
MKKLLLIAFIALLAACTKDNMSALPDNEATVETTATVEDADPPFATITVKAALGYEYDFGYYHNIWTVTVTSTDRGELYDELYIDMMRIVSNSGKVYLMIGDWETPNLNNYGPYDYLTVLSNKIESFDDFEMPWTFDDRLPDFEGDEYVYIEDFKFTVKDGYLGNSIDWIINDNNPSIQVGTTFRTYNVSFDPSIYYLR